MDERAGFAESVEQVRSRLDQSDALDAFMFAAGADDQLTMTKGVNVPEVNVAPLLGIQLLTLWQETDIHPAIMAHDAVQWAVDQADSDEPMVSVDHDA